MPFPGQFAFDPVPRLMEIADGQTRASSAVSNDENSVTISTTGKETAPVNRTSIAASPNPFGFPPLIRAAELGDLAALDRLLTQEGVDINQVEQRFGVSALSTAAALGQIEVVRMLLKRQGINLDQTNFNGDSALHLAVSQNKPDVVACLLNAGANVNLEKPRGHTALILAAELGHVDALRMLLKREGINLDQSNFNGDSALHVAAFRDKPDVVACLLKAGASVNLETPRGHTALTLATDLGHVGVIEILLKQKDIDLDLINSHGRGALHLAASLNKPDVVACLLNAGANVNLETPGGHTALILAVELGHVDVIKVLLKREGIKLDQTNADGDSALHVAVFQNMPDVVACLLTAGAEVNLENTSLGTAALGIAAYSGYIEIVNFLLKRKDTKLNKLNASGASPLHLAAACNKPDVVASLLDAGAKVNLENTEHRASALGLAAAWGHVEVVKVLLTRADIKLEKRTANGDSAVDLALRNRHAAVIELLLEHGAQLPDFDFFATGLVPFTITLADLQAEQETPVDPQANPLGLVDPQSLNQPLPFIDQLIATIETAQDVPRWLRGKGTPLACVQPTMECLGSLPATWRRLANRGQALTLHQKRLSCASAITRLRVQARKGDAARAYKAAGISAAGVERLNLVADRQIEFITTLAEQTLATRAGGMLEQLVPNCLAKTILDYQVDAEALKSSLVDAGFLAPLTQAIATSWKSALATLEAQPIVMPAGLTMKQTVQHLLDHTRQTAPQLLAQAMQRELRAQTPVTGLRSLIGNLKDAEGLHTLFQIQCDQLQQYCAQLLE